MFSNLLKDVNMDDGYSHQSDALWHTSNKTIAILNDKVSWLCYFSKRWSQSTTEIYFNFLWFNNISYFALTYQYTSSMGTSRCQLIRTLYVQIFLFSEGCPLRLFSQIPRTILLEDHQKKLIAIMRIISILYPGKLLTTEGKLYLVFLS